MAGGMKVKLDRKQIEAMLLSEQFAKPVREAAEAVADAVTVIEPRAEVDVETYDFTPSTRTSDRAAVKVVVKDGRANTWAVRDGLLVRAATAAGLQFKPHKGAK